MVGSMLAAKQGLGAIPKSWSNSTTRYKELLQMTTHIISKASKMKAADFLSEAIPTTIALQGTMLYHHSR